MNKNIFSLDFLKKHFKTQCNRGYYFRTKGSEIIHRPRGLVHSELLQAHLDGKSCLYLAPQRKGLTAWAGLDFDVLEAGQVLTVEELTTTYRSHLFAIKWSLNKTGLKPENYLFVLGGRGFHLFLFFKQFIPGNYAYCLINTIKTLTIEHYDDPSWHRYPYLGIDLRPSNIDDEKKCIQLPGFNFRANRYSQPFKINDNEGSDNDGSIEMLEYLPNIDPISFDVVTHICSEFGKQND